MAATATVRGRYVSIAHKTWDGFVGRDGPVDAGETLSLWVVTDGDGECVKVWVPREDIDRALLAVDGLKFGDRVELAVSVGAKNSYRFIDRVLPQAPGAAVGAPVKAA